VHHFEAFTAAKDPARPETNEDQMVLRPGLVLAVIDGATDISGERFDDPLGTAATGGRLAARAMAQALSGWAAGETDAPPDPLPALEATNGGLLSLYHRIGRLDAAASNGELRFRATFAGAFFSRDCIRLVRLGDSGFRVNGRPVLEKHYPGDTVLSAARSAGWQRLSASGLDADSIRPLARQLIVRGLGQADALAELGFTADDITAIEADVMSRPAVLEAVGGDQRRIRHILSGGLEAIRRDPASYEALAMDGFSDFGAAAIADFVRSDVETLEIYTDGYPALPEAVSLAAWEAALRHADETDPERIDAYPSTKGCDAGRFGDDRTIIIARSYQSNAMSRSR